MKKKNNNKKIPAYAFGINQGLDLTSFLGAGMQGFAEEGSAIDIAGSTLGGAAKGATTGLAAAGPVGAIVGGAVGGVGNLVSGILKKKAIDKQKRIEANSKEVAMGKSNAATLEQEYWTDNSLAYTFENGGILSDLAFVDNNEVIRDDFGKITQVPNNKPGTDNHLIDASNLDSVLSDKIKKPGTNKTFAQEGKKLVNMTKRSKGNDRFARNADRLNKINANIMYEQLLDEQETIKAKKGVKPKVKGIPAYRDGKRSGIAQLLINEFNSKQTGTKRSDAKKQAAKRILENGFTGSKAEGSSETINTGDKETIYMPPTWGSLIGGVGPYLANTFRNSLIANNYDWLRSKSGDARAMDRTPYKRNYVTGNIDRDINYQMPMTDNQVDGITGETILVGANEQAPDLLQAPLYDFPEVELPDAVAVSKPVNTGKATYTKAKAPVSKPDETFLKASVPDLLQAPSLGIAAKKPTAEKIGLGLPPAKKQNKPDNTSMDFSSLSGLSPILYNWIQSTRRPEVEDQVINPYSGAINRAMASRRLNIEPTLAANRRSRAIARNNMSRLNPNTGMNLAYGNQLATGEYAQNASVYANRDNANNQYLGEYANMMNNLGQQFIQNTVLTNDLNARNRAAARNFGSTAAGQLGQWSQTKEQMRNQYNRDMMLLPFYEDFLKYGSSSDKVNKIVKSVKKG